MTKVDELSVLLLKAFYIFSICIEDRLEGKHMSSKAMTLALAKLLADMKQA